MTHVNIPTRLVLAKDQRCPDLSHLKKKRCTLCQRSKVFSTVVTWLFFPATRMFQLPRHRARVSWTPRLRAAACLDPSIVVLLVSS